MYPARFRYEAPRTLDEALDLLRTYGDEAKVLAGGQSLIPMLKLRFAAPELLVDINGLPASATTARTPTARCESARCAGTSTSSSPTVLPRRAPAMAACRAADRRPDRAQPGHARRVAVPRRPAGRLGVGDARARRLGDRRAAGRAACHPDGPSSSPGRSRTRWARRDRGRGPDAGADGHAVTAGYLKLERRVGDFATVGVAVALETGADGAVIRAGIALTGVGPATTSRRPRPRRRSSAARWTPDVIDRAAHGSPPRRPRPRTDHRGSADYKRHVVAHVRRAARSSCEPRRWRHKGTTWRSDA